MSGDEVMEHKPVFKRSLEECEGGEEEMEEGGEGVWGEGSKRARDDAPLMKQDHQDNGQDKDQDTTAQNTRPDMNFPLPDEDGIPCLVKVSIESYIIVCKCVVKLWRGCVCQVCCCVQCIVRMCGVLCVTSVLFVYV